LRVSPKARPKAQGAHQLRSLRSQRSHIPTYGWHTLTLNHGPRRDITWRFVVAGVQIPIIGVDLLANLSLFVDSRKNRIRDRITSQSKQAQTASIRFPNVKTIGSSTPTDELFTDFPDLTRPSGVQRTVRISTVHHIKTTTGPPVSCRTCRLAPDRLAIDKSEFDAMLMDGRAWRSDGCCSSAIQLVPKKDRGWRPCGDYIELNVHTIPNRYPGLYIHHYSHRLAGCTIF
jgi:hypothetical protein